VHTLKRKRRSRKIVRNEVVEEKFSPLVPGARQSVQETIISAYAGDKLEDKQLAGEDYWVDPAELKREVDAQRNARSRLKQYKRKERPPSSQDAAARVPCPDPHCHTHAPVRD